MVLKIIPGVIRHLIFIKSQQVDQVPRSGKWAHAMMFSEGSINIGQVFLIVNENNAAVSHECLAPTALITKGVFQAEHTNSDSHQEA